MASIFCKYLDGTTNICYNTDSFSDIKVNKSSIGLTTEYNVNSTDEVEFVLIDTTIGQNAFQGCTSLKNIVIPDTITYIGQNAFCGCTSLTSVTIGSGVTEIGMYAFYGCYNLREINARAETPPSIDKMSTFEDVMIGGTLNYPAGSDYSYWLSSDMRCLGYYGWNGVKEYHTFICTYNTTGLTTLFYRNNSYFSEIRINDIVVTKTPFGDYQQKLSEGDVVTLVRSKGEVSENMFYGISSLESIIIPDGVPLIDRYAFARCTSLKSIVVPDSVTEIRYAAFNACTSLETIELNSNITSLGEYVFDGCSSLKVVDIPYKISEIPQHAFHDCASLESIVIPDSVKYIKQNAFQGCTSLKNIVIPDNIQTIWQYAFAGCTSLKNVTLGDNLTQIGDYAFQGCTSLNNIIADVPVAPSIRENTFNDVSNKGTLIFRYGYNYSSWIKVFDSNWEYIILGEDGAPFNPPSISCEYNTLGETKICNITDYFLALRVNGVIKGVKYRYDIAEGDKIEFLLFENDILLGYTVSSGSRGSGVFEGCTSLVSITLPDTISGLGDGMFYGCTSLKTVNGLKGRLYGACFAHCTSLEYLDASNVLYIGNSVFAGCSALKTLKLDNIRAVDRYAFQDCTSLESIFFGPHFGSIDSSVFKGCTSLKLIECKALEAPSVDADGWTFYQIAEGGTFYYPSNSTDYYTYWIGGTFNGAHCSGLYYKDWNCISVDLDENGEFIFPSITINPTNLNFEGEVKGVQHFVDVDAKGTVSITSPVEWVYEVPSMRVENEKYYFTCDDNILTPRNTTIEFKAKSGDLSESAYLNVEQDFIPLYLNVTPTSIKATSDGGVKIITIDTNATTLNIENDDWYTVTKMNDTMYQVEIPANTKHSNKKGTITFTAMIDGADDVIKTISVYQDELYLKPEIRIDDTDFNFTSIGGSEKLQVEYYGATEVFDVTSDLWLTITGKKIDFHYEDDVRVDLWEYTIKAAEGTYARQVNITFSCTDAKGKVFTNDDVTVYQSEPMPQASVVVSKNNVSLNNIGDTADVQVTYVNVDEVIPPEAPEGYTIVEASRQEGPNGIQITYTIQRVSAKKSNGTINFSGTNKDGGSATSSNVNVKGEAVPTNVEITDFFPKEGNVFYIGKDGNDSDVKIKVYNPVAPYQMAYRINDPNYAISCVKTESGDYTEDYGYVWYNFYFETIENNTNKPFTGTIDFIYTDENTNDTISLPFYVRHATEGRIHLHVENYKFDKDGNNLNTQKEMSTQVSYINIDKIAINEPVVDGDWIHFEKGVESGNFGGDPNSPSYKYSFTVDANDGPSRKAYVTFSGTGIDGNHYEAVWSAEQEGNDTVHVDTGMIALKSFSTTIPSTGGTDTVQVEYTSPVVINAPVFEGNWATITEIASENRYDTAYNGVENVLITTKTYQITVTESTDYGRQGKIRFSGEFWEGIKYEKDNYTVFQLAEGSTELQGSIVKLRGDGVYTYYGTPYGWHPEVGYIDVYEVDPEFDADWCRVKYVNIDNNVRGYDYTKEYILELDENYSEVGRQCTMTFKAECEDGTYIATSMIIRQEGYEQDINDDAEYSNYKGYFTDFDGAIHSVSFITNPRSTIFGEIRLSGESPVVVNYSESDKLYDPLRTSTCTVRVISSSYLMNLYTGKAQGTQVILKNEGTGEVEWCGYLQPNLYNQGFSSPYEEIEFEASDCLSTLQYLKHEYIYNGNGEPMIVSFKDIIDKIMYDCKLINSYYYTEKLYSNSEENKVFNFNDFYISENNFYSEEDEPWTMKEVLEETCKYFGYVCFQWGDSVYFMDYDKYQNTTEMRGYKAVKNGYNWNLEEVLINDSPKEITEESYRGTGADMSLDDIFNKVSVECNYYNVEDVIPDLFEDNYLTERNTITRTSLVNRGQEVSTKSTFIIYDHKNIDSTFYLPVYNKYVNTSVHETKANPTEEDFKDRDFLKTYVGGNIIDMYHLGYSDLRGMTYESKEWERYLLISQLNRPWCQGAVVGEYDVNKYWETYNLPIMTFKNLPKIFIDNNEEVFENTTTGSTTGGRVPSTGGSSSTVPRATTGIGTSSSTSRNDRNQVVINKSANYLVIKAEAAFVDDFNTIYIPDTDTKGFGKKSNNKFGGWTYDPIRYEQDRYDDEGFVLVPKLTFYLEIPQAGWWNGKEWVDYETWFEVPLEDADYLQDMWYTFKGTKNNVQTNLFLGETGYKIELPPAIESTQFMQFKIGMPKRFAHVLSSEGGDDTATAGNAYCFIKNLEMKIVNKNTALLKENDVVFENVLDDNNVVDGPSIDLKITSDNNANYSFSTVSTVIGEKRKPTTNFRFFDMEGEPILPEQAIIERYVNQYSTPSIKTNLTLDMSFKPYQLITDTYWNKNFVITGQEINYQECSQRVTLLQKK